jgi:hypothetical protein
MSFSPLLLDVYARETMTDRLQQAERYRMAAQLPRGRAPLRHHLARALRGLALRLDPSTATSAALAAYLDLETVRASRSGLAGRLNGAHRS